MVARNIQWYPGHMHKAGKEITVMLKKVDVVLEILDARIPYSSANPMLEGLRGTKPCLKVLTKSDLADQALTQTWINYYKSDESIKVVAVDARKSQNLSQISKLCQRLYAQTGGSKTIVTAMVMGIPNVGKSTLINGLARRTVAKTGDQPAVTKVQQVIEITPGFVLLDTPGMLWPKVENVNSGYRLAVTGAIKDTAISHDDVAAFALDYFVQHHHDRLIERYRVDPTVKDTEQVLFEIGSRRGCLVKGGNVDMDRAAKILLGDVRDGKLGRFTMESPNIMKAELIDVAVEIEARAERKAQRKKDWKNSTKR